MLKRICTVYFDAEFYLQLCQADEAEANRVIESLNSLNVRHVVSTALVRELLNEQHRNVLEKELVQRVSRFKVPPYNTEDYVGWHVFPQSGQESVVEGSSDLQEGRDETGLELTPDQEAELKEAVEQALRQAAFSKEHQDSDHEAFQVMSLTKQLADKLGTELNMNWPEDPSLGDLLSMSKQLMDPSVIARAAEQIQIPDGPFEFGDGPYKLVMGSNRFVSPEASSDEPGENKHMTLFFQHQDEIDLLQVDQRHQSIIDTAEPKHRFAELGLAERCFSVDSLTDTVEKVREMIALRLK
jgi:hypothetical protein